MTTKQTPNTETKNKKVRPAIRMMVEDGISPMSIVFSIGRLVTPDEKDYLLEYEKTYEKSKK